MEKDGQAASQSQEAETRLRTMILDMEIGPGERLTERWIETQVGASRTPVRAALQRLEAEGLVRREGRGWIVAPIDLDEIEQLFVYREVLESAAVRLAGSRLAPQAWDDLVAEFTGKSQPTSKEGAQAAGTEFHVRLAELSGNVFLTRALGDAMTRLSRARWLDTDVDHTGGDEHLAILMALREGDMDTAVKLVETHIRESRDRLLSALKEGRRTSRARGITVV